MSKVIIKIIGHREWIVFIMLLMCFQSHGQNFAEDFKAINRAYISSNLSFNLRYDYYDDYRSTKPSYFYTGVVKLNGSMVYYKMNGIEFSYDTIYTCMIDLNNKTIMVDTVKNKGNMLARINFVDSLTKVYKSVEYAALENGLAKYTIYSQLQGISHSEVIFNKSTKLIQKMTIYFFDNREGASAGAIRNKMVITYSNINTNAGNTHSVFKAQRILHIQGKKVTPLASYSHYDIINNME